MDLPLSSPNFFHQREPSLLDAIESQSFSPILLGSLSPPYWVEVHSHSRGARRVTCLRLPRLDYIRHFITLKDRVNWMMISNEEQLKIVVLWYFFFFMWVCCWSQKEEGSINYCWSMWRDWNLRQASCA